MMFNWATLPTFAVMLLFWLLAAYLGTRSPRSALSLTAIGASISAAAYLLGQGMQANATSVADWRSWQRSLLWGATVAPALWYLLIVQLMREQQVLLRREQKQPRLRIYLRLVAYPSAALFCALSAVLTVLSFVDDLLFRWSVPELLPPASIVYSRFHLREGPFYGLFMVLVVGATSLAILNCVLAWRSESDGARRERFAWLLVSAVLFFVAANTLGLASSLRLVGDWANIPSQLALGGAMLAMVWNVAAYSLLVRGQVIRRDVLYFLASLVLICLIYTGVFLAVASRAYSYQLLGMLAIVLILAILSHALVDVGRRFLDPLFFSADVQQLRSGLSEVVQDAGLAASFADVLQQAQRDLVDVSEAHVVRLTEEALRRLNSPAALARSDLLDLMPGTLEAAAAGSIPAGAGAVTPLQRAQLLRAALLQAIERLRPEDVAGHAPGALQYDILRQEYLEGLPNKQIMTRHAISESTFHRARREAISALAREISEQEAALAFPAAASKSSVSPVSGLSPAP